MCDKCLSGLLRINITPFDWPVRSLIDRIGNSLVTRPFVAIRRRALIVLSVKTARIVLKGINLC